MNRVRSGLRLIAAFSAALAVSLVPVARAFADAPSLPTAQASMAPSRRADSSTSRAHRMPRLRKPKQSLSFLALETRARSFADSSAQRRSICRERPSRAASFTALLERPPA